MFPTAASRNICRIRGPSIDVIPRWFSQTQLMHEGAMSGVKSEAERRIAEATRDANESAEQRSDT